MAGRSANKIIHDLLTKSAPSSNCWYWGWIIFRLVLDPENDGIVALITEKSQNWLRISEPLLQTKISLSYKT